jgi:hypothetical protein
VNRFLILPVLLCASLAAAAPATARPAIKVEPKAVQPGSHTLVTGTGFPKRARVAIQVDAEGARSTATRTDRRGRIQKPIWVPQGSPLRSFRVVACSRRCGSRATARLRIAKNGTRWVRRGRILPGVGAGPIRLGMTRTQVIARLGRPIFGTARGYMQYAPETINLFDVYAASDAPSARVRQIIVSFGSFTVDGVAVFKAGALRKLAARYGDRLKPTRIETGETIYRLKTDSAGWTDFSVERQDQGLDARILNVIVLSGPV